MLCVCVHVYLYGVSGGTRVCFVCVFMCIYMVCLGGTRVCFVCVCVRELASLWVHMYVHSWLQPVVCGECKC